LTFGLLLGLLTGGTLSFVSKEPMRTWEGFLMIAYAFVVLVPAIYVRWRRVPSFTMRFLCPLVAFMTLTVVFYIALCLTDPNASSITLWGHTWRLGMMLAMGSVLSAAVAQLTGTRAVAAAVRP